MNQDNGGIIGKINTPTQTVASGVWSIEQQFEAQSSSIWPLAFPRTTFTNSCRYDDGSDDYLSKTFGSSGNRKTWSFSTWVKRSHLADGNMNIIGTDYSGSGEAYLLFRSGEQLMYGQYEGGGASNNYSFQTNKAFRDTSAFYHILFVWDTTQSTSSDRMKLYVNGSQITSFSSSSYPSLNLDGVWNSNRVHYVGDDAIDGTNFDGYLAETIFVDGQALTPTSFGATNPVTNIWEPIAYTGTYGTNGFKLDYSDSSNLGDDTSGNGNDFTVNNLTSIDQSTDTPSNNFAIGNILTKGTIGASTASEGALKATSGQASWETLFGTIAVSSGKWYAEFKCGATGTQFGVIDIDQATVHDIYGGSQSRGWGYDNDGTLYNNASSQSGTYASYTANDIIGVALDMDNHKVYFSKNGTFQNSGDPTSGSTGTGAQSITSGYNYTFFFGAYNGNGSANFGSPPYAISSGNADANGHGNFEYAVPSGYFSLNTKNLSEFG